LALAALDIDRIAPRMSLLKILEILPPIPPAEHSGHPADIVGCYQLHMAQAIIPTIFSKKVRLRARKGLSPGNSERGHGSEKKVPKPCSSIVRALFSDSKEFNPLVGAERFRWKSQ
jgi:hypothetical protein